MHHRPPGTQHRRAWIVGLVLTLVLAGAGTTTLARQDQLGTPITPDPTECTIAPRSVEDLIRLGAIPESSGATEIAIASTELATPPAGVPADAETTTAVIAVVRHYIACLNAFDTSRTFALFTDRYLTETLYDFGPLPGVTLSPGQTTIVLPEEAWRSFAVASVSITGDGRAAAVVNVLNPTTSSGLTAGQIDQAIYLLAQDGEGWRIDDTVVADAARANEIVAGASFTGVVFNAQAAANLVAAFGDTGRYDQFWRPTRRHIFALETVLPGFLTAQSPTLAARVNDEEYLRQYAGVILGGTPIILVNAFCDAGPSWFNSPTIVADGGDCYFSVRYDVTTGAFFDLRINGDA